MKKSQQKSTMKRIKKVISPPKPESIPSSALEVRSNSLVRTPDPESCFRIQKATEPGHRDTTFSKWNIVGNLRVSSDHRIEGWGMMEKLLEHILDYYDGNIVFKPVILLMYWILGMNLRIAEGPSNRWSWSVNFGEPVEIQHQYSLLGSQTISYTKNIVSTYRAHQFSIEFNIKFTPTQRRTLSIIEVIKTGNCSSTLMKKLEAILKSSGINYQIEPETGNPVLIN